MLDSSAATLQDLNLYSELIPFLNMNVRIFRVKCLLPIDVVRLLQSAFPWICVSKALNKTNTCVYSFVYEIINSNVDQTITASTDVHEMTGKIKIIEYILQLIKGYKA